MKKCKSCQSMIDDKAKKCPKCQADQRNWFAKHPVITVILIIVAISIFSPKGNKSNTTTSTNKASTGTVKEEVKPTPIEITARAFADDFDENQVAAEAKWSGKLVKFSAKITNITDYGISFSSVASKEFSMAQISCRVKDKQQLMDIKNGQTITVSGIVGTQSIGVIGINDCEIIK